MLDMVRPPSTKLRASQVGPPGLPDTVVDQNSGVAWGRGAEVPARPEPKDERHAGRPDGATDRRLGALVGRSRPQSTGSMDAVGCFRSRHSQTRVREFSDVLSDGPPDGRRNRD